MKNALLDLQAQLVHAAPPAKAGLIRAIRELRSQMARDGCH
jgi:hypothetical protein